MLADNPAAFRPGRLRRKHVFLLTQGKDLAADEAGHGNPVQHAEDDEEADNVTADLLQRRPGQSGTQGQLQNAGQENHHQHVRQRVNDIHDAHDDQVYFSAAVARDGSHRHADDQDDNTCEEAHRQGNARAVDHTDEVITPGRVGTENVGKDLLPCFDVFQLGLPVGEGGKVVIRGVHGFARVHTQHFVI